MKQWTSITTNRYETDKRTIEDLKIQIKKLAGSYVPEWQFDEENPDIGSVLALIFAEQTGENIKRYNMTLEQDYVELMNMLGVSLKPASPAHSLVHCSLASDTISGVQLNGRTRLLGSTANDENLVFETEHGIYVTASKLTAAFLTEQGWGSILPIQGSFPKIGFVEEQDPDNVPVPAEPISDYPVDLFDAKKNIYGVYGLMMYHPHIFDVEDSEILMEISGGALIDAIIDNRVSVCYYSQDGFKRVSDIKRKNDNCLSFTKSSPCRKVTEDDKDYSLLLIKSDVPPSEELSVSDIRFASYGDERPADIVWNGTNELSADRFTPFSDTFALYDEIYIGHASYFNKPKARVHVRFSLSFEEHMVTIPKPEEDASLRVIKRKPRKDYRGAVAQVYAQEVSFEYFDGTAWRRLNCDTPVGQMFATDDSMDVDISFVCPTDWAPSDIVEGDVRCFRMQLIKADNCYYQPANHHYPVIEHLAVSYSYEEHFEQPYRLMSFSGSDRRDVTSRIGGDREIPVLYPAKYKGDALYMCFDKKMEDGPVSIMFQMGEETVEQPLRMDWYYSTQQGFERLRIVDYTDNLGHTGTVLFVPPNNFAMQTIEGQTGYWIKIAPERSNEEKSGGVKPSVYRILTNAVEVDNVETLPMDDYYIDAVEPNMDFALNANNILSVEVWVNETGIHSDRTKRELLSRYPSITYAEYDTLGEIRQFYVRWREVDHFDRSRPSDRHFIVDRMNSRLYFGDGVHVQIPHTTDGVAFRVRIRCCDGEKANLAAGSISSTAQNVMFVDGISNPLKAYGGRNMETMNSALCRGTSLICGRGRLVSTADYERAVLGFSSGISQVKAIVGQKKDGTYDPSAITLVVLMEDYMDGSFSFIHLKKALKDYLCEGCEISVDPDKLEIVEPVFVHIAVEAWVDTLGADDSFEVKNHLIAALNGYLNPIANRRWEIGQMVSRSQIELRLNMEKKKALVRRMMVTASYNDQAGTHEIDIEQIKGNRFVIVTSGEHRIHLKE